MDTLLQDSQTL